MAPPVASFLQQADLTGKQIVPFCTHGGGGLARIGRDIARLCPHSQVEEAFAIYGNGGKSLEESLYAWLPRIGFPVSK